MVNISKYQGEFKVNYFIVFQNKTYNEERVGEYLWAPKLTATGREIFHW